jgi:hypothetical protein
VGALPVRALMLMLMLMLMCGNQNMGFSIAEMYRGQNGI